MTYETRVTQMTVLPKGEAIFHEMATTVTVEDEAAGEFLIVKQLGDRPELQNAIAVDPIDWPTIRKAIDGMIASLRKETPHP